MELWRLSGRKTNEGLRRLLAHRCTTIALCICLVAMGAAFLGVPRSSPAVSSEISAPTQFLATPELKFSPTTTISNARSSNTAPSRKALAASTTSAATPSSNSATPTPTTSIAATTPKNSTTPPTKGTQPGSASSFSIAAGGALPSGSACVPRVVKMRERVSANAVANRTKPSRKPNVAGNFGSHPKANAHLARVDGNYTGTTDEIIQWASCKWGIDPDIVRAQAFLESSWRQGAQGGITTDQTLCVAGMKAPCPRAFGILQLRADYQKNTYPASAQSTAYNIDYSLAYWRSVYDGVSWLGSKTVGDMWGAIGAFYSGSWQTESGKAYANTVQAQLKAKPWLAW